MIILSNPVTTNATQATCTRSFQECVLSLPDLNLSCFYNVFMFIQIVPGKSHESSLLAQFRQAVLFGDRSFRKHKN